ncbi:MAG TPA: tetratricopeptide repeat protein [Pirellulales bacterium]|nr:tetratricopeptide repeat protein [Pirellulales bacterium]
MYRLISRFALASLLLANTSLAAKDAVKPLPVGSLVMAKHPGVHFRIKSQNVEAMHCGVIERVQKVEGEWLWLGRGWVDRRHVVSLHDAARYFTAEISRKATAFAFVARAAANSRLGGLKSETDNDIDQALKLDSRFAPAHYLRGVALSAHQQYDSAIDAFDEAICFDPALADAYNERGRARYEKEATEKRPGVPGTERRDMQKSLSDLGRAIQLCPRLAKAYRNRAAVFLATYEYERALADLQESLKHDPGASAAHRLIGEYWIAKGDDAQALLAVNEAVHLNPQCGKARLVRGEIYVRLRDNEKALADLNLAVELLPRSADARQARGRLYYRMGEIEKSQADRSAAMRLERKPSTTTSDTKTCSESKSKVENSAIKLFNEVSGHTGSATTSNASAKPTSTPAETPRSRANTLNTSARRCATSTDERYLNGERAVEAATQACELTEWKVADFVDTLAAAYAEKGDFDAAVKWQTKAIELGNARPTLKCEAEKRLELYRAHKPCREETPGRLAREADDDTRLR